MRKSSRGNPWHDSLGRFCHGPTATVDTWGNEITDEQRKESVCRSEKTIEEYSQRTVERKYYTQATANDPPTPKQKRFAESISKRLGIDLPEKKTKQTYSDFIADHYDEFYSKKEKPKKKATKKEEKPKKKETKKKSEENLGIVNMPTDVGKGKDGATDFTERCAEAFGANTDGVTFHSKQMGRTQGCVGSRIVDGKLQVLSCVVTSKRNKADQIHNTYHEVFHLARNGYEADYSTLHSSIFHSIEETEAEIAATTMCKDNGVNSKSFSYSEEIIRNIPRLKNSEKYKHCQTMSDFGRIFIAERRNGKITLKEEMDILSNQRFREGQYFSQYHEKVKKHFDIVYDEVTRPKDRNEHMKKYIQEEFEEGFKKLKEGKTLKQLTNNQRLVVSACIRREMEVGEIL